MPIPQRERIVDLCDEMLAEGKKFSDIGRQLGMSRQHVRRIYLQKEKIKERLRVCPNPSSTILSDRHHPLIDKMEVNLASWIAEQNSKGYWITDAMASEKARILIKRYKKQTSLDFPFVASDGWLRNFKRRFDLVSMNFAGEGVLIPQHVIDDFVTELKTIIDSESYSPEMIFNVDETGLFWKKAPKRTLAKRSDRKNLRGAKIGKKRITLLHWRANKKAWMTSDIFID